MDHYDQREMLFEVAPELFRSRYRGCANCVHCRVSFLNTVPKIRPGERYAAMCVAGHSAGTTHVVITVERQNHAVCAHWLGDTGD
jgi:hypothetical protein